MIRTAEFIRVSTEEQARHGYSLDAQRAALDDYAQRNNLYIVDRYIDEGVSARISYKKRPEFMRLINDVEQGRIDYIIFIKLDRWFRNVKEYYKVQEILETHNVNWKAIFEDFDTQTANGRLNLHIMLSLAQNESDRTSERIKFVFQDMVRQGKSYTAMLPPGLRLDEQNHIVFDTPEKVEMARNVFQYYDDYGSLRKTTIYLNTQYNTRYQAVNVHKMLANRIYIGEFAGVPNFCEALIDPDQFYRVQDKLSRNIRYPSTERIYLFSGMFRCPECGHALAGRAQYPNPNGKEYYYYRCPYYLIRNCGNKRNVSEIAMEAYLLNNLRHYINEYLGNCESIKNKKEKPRNDRAKILHKMERLKELYVNDLISMEEYRRDYEVYSKQLKEAVPLHIPVIDTSAIKRLLETNFEETYVEMSRESKQAFWHGIIQEIRLNHDMTVSDVVFL